MSTIAAGTASGTALVSTGNTDGTLQLQVNGTTPSVTLAANGSIGVGSSPAYGTNGQVLTSAGTGSAPTWTTPSSGALVFLSTVTASASATVDIETTFNATYDNYFLVISELVAATTGATLKCLLKLGGVYDTSASYSYFYGSGSAGLATFTAAGGASATSIILVGAQQPVAGRSLSLQMYITNPSSATLTKGITYNACSFDNVSGLQATNGACSSLVLTAMTGIRFFMSSGNITSGTFRLYGIANS